MDYLFIILILTVTPMSILGVHLPAKSPTYQCGDKPADILFVLDSSSSIPANAFKDQLNFVNDVIAMFDISPDKTQFGAVSFSNWAFLNFHLNTFSQQEDVQGAVRKINQIKGDTNTASAIAYVNDVMFVAKNGARPGIPHIVIVLTDGKSNHPHQTAVEAAKARAIGIHMFAIGVGKEISKGELKTIASFPHRDHVFLVDDFSALQSIKNKLAIKTCEATDPPIIPRPVFADMIVNQACGDSAMADIVFALSPGANPENTEAGLAFFRDVSLGFELDQDRVHVGLVPKDCHNVPEINIGRFTDKDDTLAALDALIDDQNSTATVLRYMRENSFSVREGARPHAKRLALIIVDDALRDKSDSIKEAEKLRALSGVEVFVVGVGKQARAGELAALATQPAARHVFHVSDYEDLQTVTFRVRNAVCPVSAL